jgi:hypothetical protein
VVVILQVIASGVEADIEWLQGNFHGMESPASPATPAA